MVATSIREGNKKVKGAGGYEGVGKKETVMDGGFVQGRYWYGLSYVLLIRLSLTGIII